MQLDWRNKWMLKNSYKVIGCWSRSVDWHDYNRQVDLENSLNGTKKPHSGTANCLKDAESRGMEILVADFRPNSKDFPITTATATTNN